MATKAKTKPTATVTTERQRVILSGWFALRNLGMPNPSKMDEVLRDLYTRKELTIESATMVFCRRYMETDEQHDMFVDEAKHWYKDTFSKRKYTQEEILRIWKDTNVVFDFKV